MLYDESKGTKVSLLPKQMELQGILIISKLPSLAFRENNI